jgi:hypothetical protein
MGRIKHWVAAFIMMTATATPRPAPASPTAASTGGWSLEAVLPMPVQPRWAPLPGVPPLLRASAAIDPWSFADGEATHVRRHSAVFDIGGAAASIDGMRERRTTDGVTSAKLWALGLHLDWPIAAGNALSFGLAQSFAKNAQPKWLIARSHLSTTSRTMEMAWLHDDRWRFSLGWHQAGGPSAANGAERLAELANGAPLHENGFSATLALLPMGGEASAAPALGIETRSETVARDELAWIGNGRRQDNRLSIFLRSRF